MSVRPDAPLPRTVPAWLPFLWTQVLFPGTPDDRTRVRPLALALVVLLPAVLLYPCRDFLLFEPDEGRYAQIPREMLTAGTWVVPTLQGEPYLDKPPLMYWLTALSYAAFGVSEAAARLVPAVCVHLTILAVYLIGRRSIGERGAMWAALLLTVSPGYLSVARLLLLDGLLTMCVTVSVLCAFEAVRTGRMKLGWWLAAAVASGFGFLTKGPISEVLLFPPLLAVGFLNRSTARVGFGHALVFALVVVGVNLPWYVAIYREQPAFLGYFFWEHNVMRFVQPFDHLQPVWYYVPILLGGFLPGVLVGVPYLLALLSPPHSDTLSPPRSSGGGFWLLSGLWCVFFFSCSGSKLPTYILPAFPPLCLALGEFVARTRWNDSWAARGLIASAAGVVAGMHFVLVPWYAEQRSPMGRPELVEKYVNDPSAVVVSYPRNVDSVAFYTGRADLKAVRTKNLNQCFVDSHFRPRTVFLFTHAHSLAGFREALPPSLRITETVSLRRSTGQGKLADKLVGATPWGLCDIAVVEPVIYGEK
ncbi:MAG: ArnT family glycosyltransferase [Fimbriiglobus sp.]